MKKNNNYTLDKMRKFLGEKDYERLPEIHFMEGKEIYLSEIHILICGELELFYMSKTGSYTKVRHYGRDCYAVIGLGGYFDFNKELFPFFRSKSKVILKKIPHSTFEQLLKNKDFSEWFMMFLFEYLSEVILDLFMSITARNEKVLKHFLKKECNNSGIVTLENVFDFIDKYNMNRSSFYNGLKKLEKNNEIKKIGKDIQILK